MIKFGALLWIDGKNHSAVNNKNKHIASYFRQIDLLAKTLKASFGAPLVVMTNDRARILSWFMEHKRPAPDILQIPASITIPAGTAFYTAHHKIDALIASLGLLESEQDHFFLLDTDIVALRPFDEGQIAMIQTADLIVYDISEQVFPAYGAARIKADIERIANETFNNPRWFGGEMVGGNRKGIASLIEKATGLLPRYFENLASLHHIGDEMFMTCALNLLLKENCGIRIVEQTPYRLISRHWSRHTDHSFAHHMLHNFVHCPGSKPALELLSFFKSPGTKLIYGVLKFYQLAVLGYQLLKKSVRGATQ